MRGNAPQKRNAVVSAFVVLLLLVTTIASCLGMYAWAKYITQRTGNSTQDIAKWNFSISLQAGEQTVTSPTQTLDLATTLYNEVAADRIAPGTSGSFDIVIDTTGTQVSLQYDVIINVSDCPRNIIFTKQGPDDSSVVPLSAGGTDTYTRQLTFSRFVPLANVNTTHTETIYWSWPYEGTVGGNATTYDEWDTADNGKQAKLAIAVTGAEVLGLNPNSVQALARAGTIKRWDTINYDPGSGTTASINLPEGASINDITKVAAINLPDGASIESGTISASEASDWVVLDVNESTGEVLIMPKTVSSTELTLSGKDGYNNAKQALNAVAGIYVNPAYAQSARSLTKEDCDTIANHEPDGNVRSYNWNHAYGQGDSDDVNDPGDITYTGSNSNKIPQTYESTARTAYECYTSPSFAGIYCWLASRCLSLGSSYCFFSARYLTSSYVNYTTLFSVYKGGGSEDNNNSFPVMPVVSLKPNVELESSSTFYTESAASATVVEQSPTAFEHNEWSFR